MQELPERPGGLSRKYCDCHICNIHGLLFEHINGHLQSKSHKYMKMFYDNGLWPNLEETPDNPKVYKFLDFKGTAMCVLCSEVVLDGVALLKHQHQPEHLKVLTDRKLQEKVPVIFACDVCNVALRGHTAYFQHNSTEEHKQKSASSQQPQGPSASYIMSLGSLLSTPEFYQSSSTIGSKPPQQTAPAPKLTLSDLQATASLEKLIKDIVGVTATNKSSTKPKDGGKSNKNHSLNYNDSFVRDLLSNLKTNLNMLVENGNKTNLIVAGLLKSELDFTGIDRSANLRQILLRQIAQECKSRSQTRRSIEEMVLKHIGGLLNLGEPRRSVSRKSKSRSPQRERQKSSQSRSPRDRRSSAKKETVASSNAKTTKSPPPQASASRSRSPLCAGRTAAESSLKSGQETKLVDGRLSGKTLATVKAVVDVGDKNSNGKKNDSKDDTTNKTVATKPVSQEQNKSIKTQSTDNAKVSEHGDSSDVMCVREVKSSARGKPGDKAENEDKISKPDIPASIFDRRHPKPGVVKDTASQPNVVIQKAVSEFGKVSDTLPSTSTDKDLTSTGRPIPRIEGKKSIVESQRSQRSDSMYNSKIPVKSATTSMAPPSIVKDQSQQPLSSDARKQQPTVATSVMPLITNPNGGDNKSQSSGRLTLNEKVGVFFGENVLNALLSALKTFSQEYRKTANVFGVWDENAAQIRDVCRRQLLVVVRKMLTEQQRRVLLIIFDIKLDQIVRRGNTNEAEPGFVSPKPGEVVIALTAPSGDVWNFEPPKAYYYMFYRVTLACEILNIDPNPT